MSYKIGDVARLLGISPDLLRYYEKKGVVTPYKDAHNDYRYYDAWDINLLMDCLWFKNFGFSIEQIADMVRIPSAEELGEVFLGKEEELRATIHRCELLLRRSEEHRAQLARIPTLLGRCELADSPARLRYINRVGEEYPAEDGLERIARQWLRALPFNHRYFEIPREALFGGSEDDYRWGFSLEADYVRELDFPTGAPMEWVAPTHGIHTVFKSRGKGNFSPRHLAYALDWAREQGLTVCGAAQGVLMASLLDEGELCGYFECWIPVTDKKEDAET